MDDFRFIFAYTGQHESLRQADTPRVHDILLSDSLAGSVPRSRCEDSITRQFTFKNPEKIRELARRGEAWGTSEDKQMLECGIEVGRGGCYLRLTPGQYAKLRRI